MPDPFIAITFNATPAEAPGDSTPLPYLMVCPFGRFAWLAGGSGTPTVTGVPSTVDLTIVPNGRGQVMGNYNPTSFMATLDTTGYTAGVYALEAIYNQPITAPLLPFPVYLAQFTLISEINLTSTYTCGSTSVVLDWTEIPGGDDTFYVKRNGTLIATVVGAFTYTDNSFTVADFGNSYEYTITGFNTPFPVSNILPVSLGLCPPTWPGCEGPQLTVSAGVVAGATAYLFYLNGTLTATQASKVFVFTGLTMETPYSITYAVVVGGVTSPQSPAGVFTPCPVCAWTPVPQPACADWTPKPPV